jgi:tRNA (guanine-N7-)-methyltransferase
LPHERQLAPHRQRPGRAAPRPRRTGSSSHRASVSEADSRLQPGSPRRCADGPRRLASGRPLILDAGCGVGWSTQRIAETFPEHFIFGVDQSVDRIGRGKPLPLPANALLIRADLVDFWRLLVESGIRLARHYNLYPNPWPKIGHLARRWHGHAVFPVWKELGGELECRSNWQIYIEEMARALTLLSGQPVVAEPYVTDDPITPFEKKYLASGHQLWRCRVKLS